MRGFSDEERARIREELIETGRELLVTYGPTKTTVEDITEPVGIAKPTFYRFFDAKADLYLEVLQREMEEYVENARSELGQANDVQEGLKRFFRCYAEFAQGNPIVQKMIVEGKGHSAMRNVSPEKLEQVQREGMAAFIPLVEELQAQSEGPLRELEPFMILSLMGGSIGLLAIHQEDFEAHDEGYEGSGKYYEQVRDLLIGTLARGLTAPE